MTTKLLDSDVCIALFRGVRSVEERYLTEAASCDFALSAIGLSELWYGADRSVRPAHHRAQVAGFLRSGIEVIDFTGEDARVAGRVRAELSRRGVVIGANDLLIASQALARGLTIVTGNVREFSRVDGLAVEDWSKP